MPSESLNLPYLTLSGIVFLAIVVSFAVYKPQIEEWRSGRAEHAALSARRAERQQFLATIDQKSADLRTRAAAEQELAVVLPPDESFDDVLRIIDRHAAAAGVRVKDVDNTTANVQSAIRIARALDNDQQTPEALIVYGATIQFEASYQQIRQFISSLENAARFMDASNLTVAQIPDRTDLLDGSLSVRFYSLSPQP